MLRGNRQATVDDKGRLKIPAAFLDSLKKSGKRFFVTSEDGQFAHIYPMTFWEGIERKLSKKPAYDPTKKKFLDRVNYYGQEVELDGQGRILLPEVLRDAAQLKGDVDVLGQSQFLDVWNHTRYVEHMQKNPLSVDDFKELGI